MPAVLAVHLQENIPALAAAPSSRKRKVVSPAGKSGPLAKRPASAVARTAAPSGRKAAPAPAPASAPAAASADDSIWDAVAEETGWTLADCLNHRLAFARRADAKAKVEALAQHVKRLRAAGWHLHDAWERAAADAEALSASLAREEAARAEDCDAHDAALRGVQAELGALKTVGQLREAELGRHKEQVMEACGRCSGLSRLPAWTFAALNLRRRCACAIATALLDCHPTPSAALQAEQLRWELAAAREGLRAAEEAARAAAAEGQRLRDQADDLAAQGRAAAAAQQQAQQYNAQLQEYNSRMQGELQASLLAWQPVYWPMMASASWKVSTEPLPRSLLRCRSVSL
jgi:hypothetical protein